MIAIQGHLSRGKEVIQILKSLGGKNREEFTGRRISQYYFINCNRDIDLNLKINLLNRKLYTLEEFETEFPFKVGDLCIYSSNILGEDIVVKILGMTIKDDCIMYEIGHKDISNKHSYIYRRRETLKPYKEMKEERNVTLTLEKAKEWYKKGGELKEVALQAFTEKELTKVDLPKTWEEFCRTHKIMPTEAIIKGSDSSICFFRVCGIRHAQDDRNMCPSGASAEAHLAMIQLEQLRNCWWGDWKPEWNASHKYSIKNLQGELTIIGCSNVVAFLVFPTKEMAEEFLECFRDLIEMAGDLI